MQNGGARFTTLRLFSLGSPASVLFLSRSWAKGPVRGSEGVLASRAVMGDRV